MPGSRLRFRNPRTRNIGLSESVTIMGKKNSAAYASFRACRAGTPGNERRVVARDPGGLGVCQDGLSFAPRRGVIVGRSGGSGLFAAPRQVLPEDFFGGSY